MPSQEESAWPSMESSEGPHPQPQTLLPKFQGMRVGRACPMGLADTPVWGVGVVRVHGWGFSLAFSHLVLQVSLFQGKSPGEPGTPAPAPQSGARASRPPQMAVSQRTVCCRRQGGVPDLRGSGPRRQLGRMGMLSCLQRPRSGRWRALISLHTQRLRSITSSSLPSRSRAG